MSSVQARVPADPVLRARDEKLESLKAVVGKLAHDFNNFLAPQYGYLTMLKDEAQSASTIAMYVEAMTTAAQKAETYLSTILMGMRPYRQASPRDFWFNRILGETVNQWAASLPPGKEVRIVCELEEFTFCGDEKQWRTVFDHLLSNARYALAMGGELEVTLRRQQLPGSEVHRLGLSTDNPYCLRVRDSGFGMSPQVIERAFEPFFTTRTQIKAPGLGLPIVHGITLFHGGQIELESVEDRGTTITIWLPPQPVWRQSTSVTAGLNTHQNRRVLLIEDDPLIREVLRSWITQHNLELENATTEIEAKRALERSSGEFVLVLCEADLQSGRGEEIYLRLANPYPALPWVFLRGSRMPQITPPTGHEEPLIIKKPFSHNAFSDLLRKYSSR